MDDNHRVQAALVGFLVAVLYAGFTAVAFIFSEPPPDQRKILHHLVVSGLVVISGVVIAYLCAPWAADAANQVLAWLFGFLHLKLAFKVDGMSACGLITGVAIMLIADPTARQRFFTWVKAKIPGGA